MINIKGIIKGRTDWKSLDFIIDKKENCIMKFLITPIHKHTYIFYLFEDNNIYYLKYINYDVCEHFNLMKETATKSNINKNTSFNDFLNIYYKNQLYQNEIKTNYLKIIKELDQKFIVDKISKIKKLDFISHDRPTIYGLDGFSVDAQIFEYDFWSHDYCTESYYSVVIELANYMLDYVDVDKNFRFKKYIY